MTAAVRSAVDKDSLNTAVHSFFRSFLFYSVNSRLQVISNLLEIVQ